MNRFNNRFGVNAKAHLFALLLVVLLPLNAIATEENPDSGAHNAPNNDLHNRVEISAAMAKASDIETQAVGGGQLNLTTRLYGQVIADPTSISHLGARFKGVVTQVQVNLGDRVKKNDLLAQIESNESLRSYQVRSPITGTVIARNANSGELANQQTLFSIANTDRLWVELKVFPNQRQLIAAQQEVILSHSGKSQSSRLSRLIPSTDNKPYTLAYAKLNSVESIAANWPMGAWVNADVVTAIKQADLLVPKEAIQQYQNQTVVFVQQGTTYRPQPVRLGQADNNNVEILAGIQVNDSVVTKNSFLIKADLEKSEAGHAH